MELKIVWYLSETGRTNQEPLEMEPKISWNPLERSGFRKNRLITQNQSISLVIESKITFGNIWHEAESVGIKRFYFQGSKIRKNTSWANRIFHQHFPKKNESRLVPAPIRLLNYPPKK